MIFGYTLQMSEISGSVDFHHDKHTHVAKNVEDNHSSVASTVGTLVCSIHKGIWISRSGKYFGRETIHCPHCLADFATAHNGPSEERGSDCNSNHTAEAKPTKLPQQSPMKQHAVDDTDEKDILMRFAASCNFRSWYNKRNWGSEKPLCDWYGVCTNSDGRKLRYNNLRGEISAELAGLSCLVEIELGYNKFSGVVCVVSSGILESVR